ncbi:MAG: response regulator [Myxococcales bacterium]|nr:response regulator [Myxococcales bacterium]
MSKTVLFVDDSATMQQVADITFRGTEFSFVGATSAEAALAQARSQKPSVVLADAHMPGKTGYDLCQDLKSDPALADVPVVILCGNTAAYDPSRGTQVAADGTLAKPWDSTQLIDKLGEILQKVATSGTAKLGGRPATASAAMPAAAPPAAANAFNPGTLTGQVPASAMPPRSATMMGMPGVRPPGAQGTAQAQPLGPSLAPSPNVAVGRAPSGLSAAVPAADAGFGAGRPAPRPSTPMSPNTVPARPASTGLGVAPAAGGAQFARPGTNQPAMSPPISAPVNPADALAAVGSPRIPTTQLGSGAAPIPARAPTNAPAPAAAPAITPPARAPSQSGIGRAPMVGGTPTKRSALVDQTLAKMAARLAEASGLAAGSPELLALLKLSTEVVERIVWEVVPELAERIVRENLEALTKRS